VVVCQYF